MGHPSWREDVYGGKGDANDALTMVRRRCQLTKRSWEWIAESAMKTADYPRWSRFFLNLNRSCMAVSPSFVPSCHVPIHLSSGNAPSA